VRVSRGVAVNPRQKSAKPQQPDVAHHETLIGWRGPELLDRGARCWASVVVLMEQVGPVARHSTAGTGDRLV
jgi:hypothetical protein